VTAIDTGERYLNQASCVEAMLRSCGWRSIRYLGEEIYHCGDRTAGLPIGARPEVLTGPGL
jgi:hypothetical protein